MKYKSLSYECPSGIHFSSDQNGSEFSHSVRYSASVILFKNQELTASSKTDADNHFLEIESLFRAASQRPISVPSHSLILAEHLQRLCEP